MITQVLWAVVSSQQADKMAQNVDRNTLLRDEALVTTSNHQPVQADQHLVWYRYAPGALILLLDDVSNFNGVVHRGVVTIVTRGAQGWQVAGWVGTGQPISRQLLDRYPQPVELRAAGVVVLCLSLECSLPVAQTQRHPPLPIRVARRGNAALRFAQMSPLVIFMALIALLGTVWQSPWRTLLSEFSYGLASVQLASNNLTEASALLRTSLDLNPRLASAQNDLGYIYHQQGQLEEARSAFLQATTADPALAASQNNLGVSYLEEGRAELARAALSQAVALAPEDVALWVNLGMAAQQAHESEEAIQAYLAALRLEPGNLVAQVNLGVVYFQGGQLAEAQRYLEMALQSQPELSRARLTLGAIALSEGDFDRARSELGAVSVALADDPSLHFYLALWYEHAGLLEQARQELDKTIALDPYPDLAGIAHAHLAALAPPGAVNHQP